MIPKEAKHGLTMDRTNWKTGDSNINILTNGIVYEGVAFPILFKMKNKFGNSNCSERIEIMEKYESLFGFESVDYLVADREFIVEIWLGYLNRNKIQYHIRIRDNFKIYKTKESESIRAKWLFAGLKMGAFKHYPKIVYVNYVACYVSESDIKSKTGKPEFQFLISFNNPSKSNFWCYHVFIGASRIILFKLPFLLFLNLRWYRFIGLLSYLAISLFWYSVGSFEWYFFIESLFSIFFALCFTFIQ